jgi:putative oxidoreductase
MKKLLNVTSHSPAVDTAVLIARVGIGALMLTHGIPKMAMLFSGGPVQFPPVLGLSAGLSLGLAVFAEVICSILLLAGLATRLAVIPLIITMLVALFSIHGADPLAKQEPALHYLLVYVVLLLTGSGKYSLDYLFQKKSTSSDTDNIQIRNPTFSSR